MKRISNLCIVFILVLFSNQLNAQAVYTFTSAGATGKNGPTQLQLTTAYNSTNLNGLVTSNNGIQLFTIPQTGNYRIEVYGAQGGHNPAGTILGGLGAKMEGDFALTGGAVLKIIVGQAGINAVGTGEQSGGTGGGGSYVATNVNVPLIVAGGGGGFTGSSYNLAGKSGTTSTSGLGSTNAAGGTLGSGGVTSNWTGWHDGTGGGGFTGNGVNNSVGTVTYGTPNTPGLSFINGGTGGTAGSMGRDGGFGGGGASGFTGGGGGGYSGGGGGTNGSPPNGGGGGGSYNSGTNQVNASGVNSGNGLVIIRELCNISITALGVTGGNFLCAGNSATLTTNAISNYSWSTGATTSSIAVSPSSNTVYTLTATSAANCTTSTTFTVNVNSALPSLTVINTASASGGICPTNSVNLTASGANTYTWSGGSPTVTNGVTFFPTAPHDYTVSGQNGCGTSTAVTSVSVHPFPTVNPSASSATLCAGGGLTLTATGNATNYVWSGGNAPAGNSVGFVPPASTITYTAIGTSALSCTAQATIPVTVHATPSAAPAANPALICIGGSSTLTATGALSYTWASATQTVFTPTFVVTPSSTGVSTYTVTKANSTCADTKLISVTTNSLPGIFAMATPTLVCALQPVTLTIGGGTSYTWTAPGTPNFTFTGASPVVYPQSSTDYTVAASDGTCITLGTVSVTANPNPTLTTSASSPSVCSGSPVTLSVQGGNSYTWTAGTTTLYTPTVTDSPTISMVYDVTGDNSFSCTALAQQIVLVFNNPTITTSASKTLVCSGAPSTLTATGANTYTWDANAGGVFTNTVIVNPTSLTSAMVIYTVSGSFTTSGCQSSKTVQASVYVPTLTVTGATNTCKGGQISLTAGGGASNSFTWNTGSTTSNFQTITTTLSAPAIFTVSAISTSISAICLATQTVAVGFHPDPSITATAERSVICSKESTQLFASGGQSYTWSNSSPGATITVSPTNQTSNYVVTGTDVNGCIGSGTVQVKVQNCTGIGEQGVKNAGFSVYPNPNNGEFIIKSDAELHLQLINELGQVVRTVSLTREDRYEFYVTELAKGVYFLAGQKDDTYIALKISVLK